MVKSLKGEVWRQALKQVDYYQLSNLGRCKTLDRWVTEHRNGKACRRHVLGHILHSSLGSSGYLQIHLMVNGHYRTYTIHRLVAEVFVPNPHHYPYVNHLNEDKTDNRASNLEWCTAKMNSDYGHATMRATLVRSKPAAFVYHGRIKYFKRTLQAAIWLKRVKQLSQSVRSIEREINGAYHRHSHTVYGVDLKNLDQRYSRLIHKVYLRFKGKMHLFRSEKSAAEWARANVFPFSSLPYAQSSVCRCCLRNQQGHYLHRVAGKAVCCFYKSDFTKDPRYAGSRRLGCKVLLSRNSFSKLFRSETAAGRWLKKALHRSADIRSIASYVGACLHGHRRSIYGFKVRNQLSN